jgi:(2Fe-2S) ferredoxin
MNPLFDIHIFVCTNERTGTDKLSCGEAHGMELVTEFKRQLKNSNVQLKTRAQRAGCMGVCDFGPTIAIYPEGVFYVGVKKEDVSEIIESHIINKKPVERLLMKS